jgi:hypothetical protein
MHTFLQLDDNVATATLCADHAPTVLPAGRSFINVTDREDAAVLGATYDSVADVFTAPPEIAIDPDDLPLTPREQREILNAILAK